MSKKLGFTIIPPKYSRPLWNRESLYMFLGIATVLFVFVVAVGIYGALIRQTPSGRYTAVTVCDGDQDSSGTCDGIEHTEYIPLGKELALVTERAFRILLVSVALLFIWYLLDHAQRVYQKKAGLYEVVFKSTGVHIPHDVLGESKYPGFNSHDILRLILEGKINDSMEVVDMYGEPIDQ